MEVCVGIQRGFLNVMLRALKTAATTPVLGQFGTFQVKKSKFWKIDVRYRIPSAWNCQFCFSQHRNQIKIIRDYTDVRNREGRC